MIALHATWLVTLWLFGWNHPLVPAFVALFIVLQVGRFWVLGTLGERWTTRIIMTPWAAPVTSGPFRFVRHPNYLIVAFELPCVSLALVSLARARLRRAEPVDDRVAHPLGKRSLRRAKFVRPVSIALRRRALSVSADSLASASSAM